MDFFIALVLCIVVTASQGNPKTHEAAVCVMSNSVCYYVILKGIVDVVVLYGNDITLKCPNESSYNSYSWQLNGSIQFKVTV